MFMSKFKIPTLLGLSLLIVGIVAGVYLNLREQIVLSQAAPDLTPQNVTLSNITEDSVTISWQTKAAAKSLVAFGQNSPGQYSVLDDQNNNAIFTHHATLKNLLPKTTYQFKIVSGKISSEIEKFETAQPPTTQTGFAPVIGTVLDDDTPLEAGVAYLSIAGATPQSAPIKSGGNFLIPLSSIRKVDLSDIYPLSADTIAKLTVVSEKGTANLLFKLKDAAIPLPPINLGQNIDLTIPEETPQPSADNLNTYDLNEDGKINAADNTIILQNLGKKSKDQKTDLNKDGKTDQKDLNLMAQKLKDLGSQ